MSEAPTFRLIVFRNKLDDPDSMEWPVPGLIWVSALTEAKALLDDLVGRKRPGESPPSQAHLLRQDGKLAARLRRVPSGFRVEAKGPEGA